MSNPIPSKDAQISALVQMLQRCEFDSDNDCVVCYGCCDDSFDGQHCQHCELAALLAKYDDEGKWIG